MTFLEFKPKNNDVYAISQKKHLSHPSKPVVRE